eukprot:1665635-Prymnesium_polylepis.1
MPDPPPSPPSSLPVPPPSPTPSSPDSEMGSPPPSDDEAEDRPLRELAADFLATLKADLSEHPAFIQLQ